MECFGVELFENSTPCPNMGLGGEARVYRQSY